jgi:hypothetical protein
MSLAVSGNNGFEVRSKFLYVVWATVLLTFLLSISIRLNGKDSQIDFSLKLQSLTSVYHHIQNHAMLHFPAS